MRRIVIVLAVMALGGVLAGCWEARQAGHPRSGTSPAINTNGGGDADGDRQTDETHEYGERILTVALRTQAASIDVDVGDGPVRVRERIRHSGDPPPTSRTVDGTTLRLENHGCGAATDDRVCEVAYQLRLPRDTALEVDSGAGSVTVRGLHGDLRVNTGAGRVHAVDLGSRNVSVTAHAGAVKLGFDRPPTLAEVRTEVGAIDVRVPGNTSYAVDARTRVGTARVAASHSPGADNRIVLRSNAGTVSVDST
ncbi:DUF4097 family beta strand repeat-containing protein [Streptoalloteichus hindustanus]|nr:DUF4097 family beta strand repeat-containing protein [Streptoalloteichus hindustanus]